MSIYGYFDTASQARPAFDPGLDVPCPICVRVLSGESVTTISLMLPGDDRSYFRSDITSLGKRPHDAVRA